MNGLISSEMIADLIINILNILILFFVTKKLLYKPVKKFLDARKQKIDEQFEMVQSREKEAAAVKEEYSVLLGEAEKLRSKTVLEAKELARDEAQKILSEAKQQASKIVSEAKADAENEHRRMLENAKNDIAQVAVEISGKIMSREINDEDNRRIIDAFFGE